MKVGSLVECIKNVIPRPMNSLLPGEKIPVVGKVYTVRHIEQTPWGVGIRLEEIINPIYIFSTGPDERLFPMKYFRELLPPMESEISEFLKQPELV